MENKGAKTGKSVREERAPGENAGEREREFWGGAISVVSTSRLGGLIEKVASEQRPEGVRE